MRKAALLLLFCLLLPLACGSAPPPEGNGLFCWDGEAVGEGRDALFDTMERNGLTVLYQYFPGELSRHSIRDFLQAAADRGIAVYYLAGEPEWALDPEGEAMLDQVSRAAKINRKLPEQARLRGVMMDAEPYLTDEWEGHEPEVTACFAQAMGKVRESAQAHGLACMLCIPFYYDNDVGRDTLSALIGSCDGLAIMNYSKRDEAGQIETELDLAGDRPVTVIYELQEPGGHGLKETNTYYSEGVEGVYDSFQTLREAFDREGLTYALHDYEALKELEEHG